MLDAVDLRILDELQRDGRMTNHELASRVGVSPSPCLRRVRALEQAGVIAGYVGLIEPRAVGLEVQAFIRIRLQQQDDRHLGKFEEAVAGFEEVMECHLVTGDADYEVRLLVRSLDDFEDFLRTKLTRIDGIAEVTTSFALRPIVCRRRVPVKPTRGFG
jgi:Lrp/AsnC family leucine-responsive transcriptional regulator